MVCILWLPLLNSFIYLTIQNCSIKKKKNCNDQPPFSKTKDYFSFYIIQNMHDDINIFKTVNNDPVTFPMSYKILKYSFWILHLTNYKEHFKSRSTKLRTINLAQCPQFTVMKIVRNLTFSLTRKGKLHPQIHTFFNQKSNKQIRRCISSNTDSEGGIATCGESLRYQNLSSRAQLDFCLCKFSPYCQEVNLVAT